MNKLNLLSLIANAAAFLMIASANAAVAKTPVMFNPTAVEFKGKVIVAQTFATWCRYCRQNAAKKLKDREKTETNNNLINIILVPEDNYEASILFFKELGAEPEILAISEKQMNEWEIIYFPSILIFSNSKLIKLFGGEINLDEVTLAVEKQLAKLKVK